MTEEIKKGLLGIVVDETTISQVVPELSALTYRGYKVQDLCDKCEENDIFSFKFGNSEIARSKILRFICSVLGA